MQELFDPLRDVAVLRAVRSGKPRDFPKIPNTNIAIFSSNKARIQFPLLFLLEDTVNV